MPEPRPPRRTDWIAGGDHVQLGGHRIFVRQDGPEDGRPVTLLHGFPTSSHDWAAVVPALTAAGCRATMLDFLGFGASDKPAGHDYTIAEQADLVQAWWELRGIGTTALVAHDYGVTVAQELLARAPGRFDRTAWLNGGLYSELHRPILIQKLLHGSAGPVLQLLASRRAFGTSMASIVGRPLPVEAVDDMWEGLVAGGGRKVQHRLLHYIDERRKHRDRWVGALESHPAPKLFLWGPADPISGGHVIPVLRERLPDARIVVLDEPPPTGHYPQVENPSVVARELAGFLGGVPGS